jgi:hypothetical protein
VNTPARLGAFGLGLVVVFTAALGLGRAAGPDAAPAATHAQHSDTGGHKATGEEQSLPAGLQVNEDGYRLVPLTGELSTGAPQPFRFRVLGPDGAPVTSYTPSHERNLHLIVVRRDLSGFQHVHPTLAADGTWSIPLAVAAAGQYRVFADFQPSGHDGLTLGTDVPAPGGYQPRPLPKAGNTATVDGYTISLAGALKPGASSPLTLSVSKDGKPVTDLQPYLGAYGHLVALRDGDLAYLHVHPDGMPGDGRTTAGPGITFHADVPSTGNYRLYLDFQHAGKARTAEFTAVAGAPPATATSGPDSAPAPSPTGHASDGHTHD